MNLTGKLLLVLSLFLEFSCFAQDYFVANGNDTTPCLLLSEELIQQNKIIYTNYQGRRDTIINASDSISAFYSHGRLFQFFPNLDYYWLKTDGEIKLYQSLYFKIWASRDKYDVRLFPEVKTLLPGTHIGEKADIFRSIILVHKGDTVKNPGVGYFKRNLFPEIKSTLQYFPKKFKFSFDNIELLIQLYNNKKRHHYEYFIDGKQDTIYCTALFYQFYYSELSKFNYSDDYDAIFFNKGRKNCLKFRDFTFNGLYYKSVTHKDFEIKNFQYGHYFKRQEGKLDLLYFGLLIPYFSRGGQLLENNLKSYFIIQSKEGLNLHITKDSFDTVIKPILEQNKTFLKLYRGDYKLDPYSLDEIIAVYNYAITKSPDL